MTTRRLPEPVATTTDGEAPSRARYGKARRRTKRSGGPANVFSLFDNEEAVLDRTEVMLTQLAAVADGVKVLAEAYRRATASSAAGAPERPDAGRPPEGQQAPW